MILAALVPSTAYAGASAPALGGAWSGSLTMGPGHEVSAAAARVELVGALASGTLTLRASGLAGVVTVRGTVRGGRARLSGMMETRRVRWRGHWVPPAQAWRGALVVSGGGPRRHGVLGLVPAGGGPAPSCGADYFASEVMPRVLEPICAQCHFPGGLAQATRLRVTVGSPTETAASAVALVDPADPLRSLLLQKPRAQVGHGGGLRLQPGSVEDQTLQHWVELVTAPGCGGGGTGNLYTDNCASCHGADARGLQGRPDIHCNRSIHDVVRSGRPGAAESMPAFPDLSDADIATIQGLLVDLCPATAVTGAELFAGNCATCHGADAGGTPVAPSVRCATRAPDAIRVGRGTAMPSVALSDAEVQRLDAHLGTVCTQHGRTGADLFAGNCASCHGATARGGRNGLGVRGPEIQCTGAHDYREKVTFGSGDMPPFPALGGTDVDAIAAFVLGTYCPGG